MNEHFCDFLLDGERITYPDYPWIVDIVQMPCGKPAHFKSDYGTGRWYCAEHYDYLFAPVCKCGGICEECGL